MTAESLKSLFFFCTSNGLRVRTFFFSIFHFSFFTSRTRFFRNLRGLMTKIRRDDSIRSRRYMTEPVFTSGWPVFTYTFQSPINVLKLNISACLNFTLQLILLKLRKTITTDGSLLQDATDLMDAWKLNTNLGGINELHFAKRGFTPHVSSLPK